MDEELLQAISIAGLLHDIGKFSERAGAVEQGDKDMVAQDYRYAHAYHTESALKSLFPAGQLERGFAGSTEVNVLNMASRHHKPRNMYELIISQADRIASGHERSGGDELSGYDTGGRERKRQTPLLSILSRIKLLGEQVKSEDFRYKINPAAISASAATFTSFFPVPKDEYTYNQVERDYVEHWHNFKKAIQSSPGNGLDLFAQLPVVLSVCKEFQWCLPASTRREELPDVSLFDHQKVTAALAGCLYWYHAHCDSLSEKNITDHSVLKFLLYCGDISGIQNFIYKISSKGAYRTLKGKSFYIQLLAEIIANKFVERFSLSQTNILYASGGKFYLMLPNLPEILQSVEDMQHAVNMELLAQYNGTLYLRTGYEALSADDLTRQSGTTLYRIWDRLTRRLVYQDRQRYCKAATDDYDLLFAVRSQENLGACEVCRQTMKDKAQTICTGCKEMAELGRQLGTANWIAIGSNGAGLPEQGKPVMQIYGKRLWLLKKMPEKINGKNLLFMGINSEDYHQISQSVQGCIPVNCVPFTIGSSHRFDTTFNEIAERSAGNFKRLGILRMDVDNLGRIFSEGLENYEHDLIQNSTRFHSLGRITTMSWQLSQFFGAVLPAMINANPDWSERVTVVYSGGDDLFLLGAWDALPDVALEIHRQFSQFSCHNTSFSLSGGMVISGGSFPIYKSAEMAGEAEAKAKSHTTVLIQAREKRQKNAFTFLDQPMHWKQFSALAAMQEKLMAIVSQKEHYPLLQRLKAIALSWQESARELKQSKGKIPLEEIRKRLQAEKWRWRMVYTLSRYSDSKSEKIKNDIESIKEFITGNVVGTEITGIELLGVLTRWSELKLR
ncbi:type III-A CRISPR-associated protein Cas10/Csm1 [Desulfobacter sp.]|uniref:type III-A CRISPR-associated protein Cas10/Csm1 n=1 Tax=Desulfobacter sp. TaxID=2294 RepID=UPI003D0C50E4